MPTTEQNTQSNEGVEQEIVDGADPQNSVPSEVLRSEGHQPEEGSEPQFDDTSHEDPDPGSEQAATDQQQQPETEQPKQSADDQVPAEEAADGGDEPEEVSWDQSLLSAAGVDEKQAEEQFGTPQALENAVRLLDSRFIQAGQQILGQYEQPAQPQQPQQPAQQPQQTRQAQSQQAETADDSSSSQQTEFKMPEPTDAEGWDEDTVKLVNELNKFHEQRHKQLLDEIKRQDEQFQEVVRERERIQQQQYVEEFDGFISSLDDKWEGTFGKGSGFELNNQSPQFLNRVKLDQTARQLAAGREAYGQPPLSPRDLRLAALRVAFPQQQEQAVRQEVQQQVTQKKVQDRQKLKTSRPTQRRTAPVDGDQKAAAYAEEWAKKHGLSVPADDFDYSEI